MKFLRHLMEKPWEPPQASDLALAAGPGSAPPAQKIGLWVFLCVVTVLFMLLTAAYAERMAFENWRPTAPQWLLWFNTTLLIESSIAFQWASYAIRRGRMEDTRTAMIAAGFLAVAFLVGQIWAWVDLSEIARFTLSNPAIDFFYLITALHGLHLLGGLIVWGKTTHTLWHKPDLARVTLSIRLCAAYWHYLLALWVLLFILLFNGSDNLSALLVFCGLQ